jgi:hypothetical protein
LGWFGYLRTADNFLPAYNPATRHVSAAHVE